MRHPCAALITSFKVARPSAPEPLVSERFTPNEVVEPALTMPNVHWESYPAVGAQLRIEPDTTAVVYSYKLAGVARGFDARGTTGEGRYA